jgi:6-phosphogluconolactonase
MSHRIWFSSGLLIVLLAGMRPARANPARHDLLYTETNDAAQNELLVLSASRDGAVTELSRVATGGRGSGTGLGSQGAVALSDDGLWLLAVNAGSNEVSLFFVGDAGRPFLVDVAPSGGTGPISVAVRQGVAYVLNSDRIVGVEIAWHGGLVPIDGASLPLSAPTAGAAQVAFTPDGRALIVTEKATNCVDELPLDAHDRIQSLTCHPSVGNTPFGFAFAERRSHGDPDAAILIVSEAFGGAPGASAVSSYRLDDRRIQPVTRSVPTSQTAACWVAVTPHGKFAYTTNTGSGTVTAFRVNEGGTLERIDDGVSGTTGGAPIDAVVSPDGRALHVLVGGTTASLVTFSVRGDGSLVGRNELRGLPPAAAGLAIRRGSGEER